MSSFPHYSKMLSVFFITILETLKNLPPANPPTMAQPPLQAPILLHRSHQLCNGGILWPWEGSPLPPWLASPSFSVYFLTIFEILRKVAPTHPPTMAQPALQTPFLLHRNHQLCNGGILWPLEGSPLPPWCPVPPPGGYFGAFLRIAAATRLQQIHPPWPNLLFKHQSSCTGVTNYVMEESCGLGRGLPCLLGVQFPLLVDILEPIPEQHQ
jgi:hypothetical protein